ncbi:MAG: sensor histidine kinase [Blautia producta]|uniref:histidine kinase n=2 Tax=Blautia producta TaxID=33035 RepID=A0A7G5MUW8_9FIRM|nr:MULTISPECIES: sensor histidine kinase [Blautia]MDU5218116.1 sensor histidine kinase [Blautia producta]MDU5384934.1 sensor histidine kinase [Blautia producta]MDU6881053.1 sensor histidine kinase [Blautia producta]QIB53893.1 HAMP domain-containing histidine kinase [Blautia producta ATCC 27340 = DSM 2950]QMW78411.1 HAMP domain-containing histidine kinase [Blautia producta]
MSGRMYWRQQAVPVLLQVLCLCAASLYLRALGLTWFQILPLGMVYMGGLVLWNLICFLKKRKYFHKMAVLMESLDKKYLFPQVWKGADTWEEAGYYCLMKECTRSMLEETEEAGRLQREYRELLESYVHDMKQPISVISLIAGREKTQDNRAVLLELEKMNHLSEQILYFGRSESPHSDFLIQKVNTGNVIRECLSMNKQLLIQNQVALDIPETIPGVYADEKALLFVLNQIIYNAVTYKRVGVTPKITFFWQTPGEDKLLLHIQDNGRGISSEDLPRVFEKGFTGKNGRENHRSTGMGLYLCKKICDRLGTDLWACSEEGVYTRFTICMQILTEK